MSEDNTWTAADLHRKFQITDAQLPNCTLLHGFEVVKTILRLKRLQ